MATDTITVQDYLIKGELVTRLCGFALGDLSILRGTTHQTRDKDVCERRQQLGRTLAEIRELAPAFLDSPRPGGNQLSTPDIRKGVRNIVDHTLAVCGPEVECRWCGHGCCADCWGAGCSQCGCEG